MFLPAMVFCSVEVEQTSLSGSVSPISDHPPFPSGVTWLVEKVDSGLLKAGMPFVWPETRFITPGVEGPKVVVQELSLIA